MMMGSSMTALLLIRGGTTHTGIPIVGWLLSILRASHLSAHLDTNPPFLQGVWVPITSETVPRVSQYLHAKDRPYQSHSPVLHNGNRAQMFPLSFLGLEDASRIFGSDF